MLFLEANYNSIESDDVQIPGLCSDPVKHPFQDIAVGGTAVPGRNPGHLSVWAVTFSGKVKLVLCFFDTLHVYTPRQQLNTAIAAFSTRSLMW